MLTLPAAMAIFGNEPITLAYLGQIYGRWGYIVIIAEFLYGCVHFNRGHHGTEQYHQNDELKSFDFGEFQLSATVDRTEANFNSFTSLAYYGDEMLHHLFPTLDNAVLPQLRATLLKTCKEFDVDLHAETSMLKAAFGQFKQLIRTETLSFS